MIWIPWSPSPFQLKHGEIPLNVQLKIGLIQVSWRNGSRKLFGALVGLRIKKDWKCLRAKGNVGPFYRGQLYVVISDKFTTRNAESGEYEKYSIGSFCKTNFYFLF